MHHLGPEHRFVRRFVYFMACALVLWPASVLTLFMGICAVKAPAWVDYFFWPWAGLAGVGCVLAGIVYAGWRDGP